MTQFKITTTQLSHLNDSVAIFESAFAAEIQGEPKMNTWESRTDPDVAALFNLDPNKITTRHSQEYTVNCPDDMTHHAWVDRLLYARKAILEAFPGELYDACHAIDVELDGVIPESMDWDLGGDAGFEKLRVMYRHYIKP